MLHAKVRKSIETIKHRVVSSGPSTLISNCPLKSVVSIIFNLYAEYIMRNAGLEETQAGIKVAGRNINNFRYADDTTLMAESEKELKSLLMRVKKKSGKSWLETHHSKN